MPLSAHAASRTRPDTESMHRRIFTRVGGRPRAAALPACVALVALLWSATGAQAQATPSVVADIAPVQSIVARVMAGAGSPALLLPAGASPHHHAMRPSEARALEGADLVVWIGPELSPGLARSIATLAPDAATVTLAELPGTLHLPLRRPGNFATVPQATTDPAGPTDPHLWLDPANAAVWIAALAERLAAIDPERATLYRANAAAAQADLTTLVTRIEDIVAPVRDRPYLVFHDAYSGFEARFGIPAAGTLTTHEAVRPGARRLSEIRERLVAQGIVCIFSEPQFSPRLIATVVEGTDVRTATLDPLGAALEQGRDLYPRLLLNLAQDLVGCLTE